MNNQDYENLIKKIPDFPKPGVVFKDIAPLLKHKLPEIIEDMGKSIDWNQVDVIAGIESRGFILGSALALKHNKGFIPVRKKGKLPPPTVQEEYTLEYGSDILEMSKNDEKLKVVIVDDVLATGGTLKATLNLCAKNNLEVQAITMLINLKFLNGLDQEYSQLYSVLNYD
ncbi:MAG: adenine phosphoribosyltransferase [Bacteriovoracaceae bacterium]|jgi:adenine phosphoribosyltransferase|nr:adenine phosphoribosyltransferase [Bacteriovoracaceae bacterium]|tara:strand:- start:199 stop:708 length:510 start_codon:yes stop_codon:yes gene_type:complete